MATRRASPGQPRGTARAASHEVAEARQRSTGTHTSTRGRLQCLRWPALVTVCISASFQCSMLVHTSSPFLELFIFLYLKGREIFHQLVPSPDAHKGQGQELRTAPHVPPGWPGPCRVWALKQHSASGRRSHSLCPDIISVSF